MKACAIAWAAGSLILKLTAVAHEEAAVESFPSSVAAIRERILAQNPSINAEAMRRYTNRIPGTKAAYAMVPIPGGEFVMGSAPGSAFHQPEEAPPHRVRLAPFWMGQCEVTWDEYQAFVYGDMEARESALARGGQATRPGEVDAVTHPTLPYVDMDFGMGKSGYPAIAMTQHAANKYCQWLSARTGHFYRLPTEAEWEYAARAGSTNVWCFGDDATKLGEYAWYEANSGSKYQKVGRKLPNAWGLHDLLGNVSEWVLDQFDADYYQTCAAQAVVTQPWNRATKPYPHSVRGGAWSDPLPQVRSAARGRSDPAWKAGDPNLPKSLFWYRSCDFVGFRIVRPLELPDAETMSRYWNSGVARE